MSPKATLSGLSRRERQIMDILYRLGRATANDVLGELPGAPSHSTVRTQLRVLESKGHVRHEEQGLRYVYFPTTSRQAARKSALKHLVETFFEEIRLALESGESVKLSGFGNFQLRDKPQRPGRNPKTGEEIPITARRVVTFHASQKLKALVEQTHGKQGDQG